jgi:hypothetical protein
MERVGQPRGSVV